MRSFRLRLACTFLKTQNSLQDQRFRLSLFSNPSSKPYFLALPVPRQLHSPCCLVVPVMLVEEEQETEQVNRWCCTLGNLMFQSITRNSHHICKECNGGLRNWRTCAGNCKPRWQRSRDQECQVIVIQDHCPSSVHERIKTVRNGLDFSNVIFTCTGQEGVQCLYFFPYNLNPA